jgi:hypothetical protein
MTRERISSFRATSNGRTTMPFFNAANLTHSTAAISTRVVE